MVTGHEEARAVYNDSTSFSSCNAVSGPFARFPEPFEGDDVTDIIERHRNLLPVSDQLPSFDPPRHTAHRALMMRLLTPGRLRANEEFMEWLADGGLEALIGEGGCEFIGAYAEPFTLRVIADLEDRRREPRDDIMTAMATATFPDGSTPEVQDVALLAANLFSGGQETTVRLLSFAMRVLGERQDIQDQLRADRERIPNFIEETLRFESPLRAQFRMAKVTTEVAGVPVTAGSTMMLLPGAANRDLRLFDHPDEFDLDRDNARYHVAFGHGIHHCAGAHLARAEGRVTINRLLDHTSSITISESAPTARPTLAATPTCRRTSCAAW